MCIRVACVSNHVSVLMQSAHAGFSECGAMLQSNVHIHFKACVYTVACMANVCMSLWPACASILQGLLLLTAAIILNSLSVPRLLHAP